jgi:hypothetical protein
MDHLLLGALTWDPQIRGALILLTAILILPGSVYLLLATNTGAKVGFVLAIAGLSGWVFVMGIIWAVYGIGLKGREKSWKVQEVVVADAGLAGVKAMEGFPKGWHPLPPGNAIRADAQAAADTYLLPTTQTAGVHPGGATAAVVEPPRFTSPFKKTDEYIPVAAYYKGGDNYLFKLGNHKFYFRHSARYAVIQIKPVLNQTGGAGGAPPTPVADSAAPTYTVVMVRDLGSLRFPPVVVSICFGLIFGVSCYWLHERDKRIWAAKAAGDGSPAPAPA